MQEFHEEAEKLIKKQQLVYEVTPLKVESKWDVPNMPGRYYTGTVLHIAKANSGRCIWGSLIVSPQTVSIPSGAKK